MPAPDWIRNRSKQARQRVCEICGTHFSVSKSSHKGAACSPTCLSKVKSLRRLGSTASAETRAKMSASHKAKQATDPEWARNRREKASAGLKSWLSVPANAEAHAQRSSERMKRRHADPEWQKIRDQRSSETMRRTWEKRRDQFCLESAERMTRMIAEGTGIASPEAKARKATAAKWIMKKAAAALRAETNYLAIFSEVHNRLRREMPYDGPATNADYHDYCSKLAHAVCTSEECSSVANAFMVEAIPRFAKELNARSYSTASPLSISPRFSA